MLTVLAAYRPVLEGIAGSRAAVRVAVSAAFDPMSVAWELVRDPEGIARACAAARDAGLCGLDVETAPRPEARAAGWPGDPALCPRLGRARLVQLAVPGHPVYLIDLAPWWDDPEALAGVLRPLAELLADPGAVKAGHNLKFDLKHLRAALGDKPLSVENLFDTMLAAQLLACGLWPAEERPFTLDAVARRELGADLDKAPQRSDWSSALSEAQLRYAALDAAVILPLWEALRRKLAEEGLERAARLEFDCVPATADLEYAGMPFDADACRTLEREEEEALRAAERRALGLLGAAGGQQGLFGGAGVNLDSPAQVLDALRRLGAGVGDTREETLQALARAGGAVGEAAAAILEYRKHAKALSAFVRPYLEWQHPRTKRVHPEYRQLNRNGVGRFSAADPNIQQVPRDPRFRRMFAAPPGRVLVIADYSAIEMRIMAWLSRDPVLLDVFRAGADPHRRTAALVLGKPEDQVTKEERQLAKSLNFGLIYGMSARGLRQYAEASYGVVMSEEEAQEFRRRFFVVFQGVAAWHRRQDTEARRRREVRTASGRARRWATEQMPSTELFNTPDQGTGADILKRAMARLRPRLMALGAELVASVHDELVAECPEDRAEEVAVVMKSEMESSGKEFIDPIPVEVEVAIGRTWADKN